MKKREVLKYQNYLDQFRNMMSFRGYTERTLISYSTYIYAYLLYLDEILNKDPNDVSWQELRDFLNWLQCSRNLSDRTMNTVIAQLRFFTLFVLNKGWDPYQVPFRKFDTYLPYVPTQEETFQFISSIPNIKVKAMVAVLYSSGLRHNELRVLRYEDVSRTNMTIYVRRAKSREARYAGIAKYAMDILTEYWLTCGKPRGYLFPDLKDNSRPVSKNFLPKKIQENEERLGLPHRLTPHSFRHALGTHLYECGASLLEIKDRLGHKSIQSTLIYIHLAETNRFKTKNPFDMMADTYGKN